MKREIAKYVVVCDSCQRIKAEHQRPVGLLQPLQIPQWKWDEIGIDFIVGLPCTRTGYDSIWVVVDRLTKSAHFIPVKTNYSSAVLAELYMSRIVCLHGVPKKIVSDRGTQFTSHFWQQLQEALGTHLNFSSAYHPQTDGQTERTNVTAAGNATRRQPRAGPGRARSAPPGRGAGRTNERTSGPAALRRATDRKARPPRGDELGQSGRSGSAGSSASSPTWVST